MIDNPSVTKNALYMAGTGCYQHKINVLRIQQKYYYVFIIIRSIIINFLVLIIRIFGAAKRVSDSDNYRDQWLL